MQTSLSEFQRSYAQYRLTLFGDGLSLELAQSLRRTSLACAENQKKQAGIVDVLCGLYLQDPEEIKRHFSAEFEGRVKQNFPSHRFGRDGLFPKAVLEQLASDSGEAGFGFYLNYSDDVLKLLWLSRRLANAVGKKPSLNDVVAALGLDQEWVEELSRSGFTSSHELADFDRDVRTVIFHATPHMGKEWPREMEFEFSSALGPPYSLKVTTPSGPFQPVRVARVKLNGNGVADVAWPEKSTAIVNVELQKSNRIELELDGPMFGSVELTVRGIPV
jgi:hypothetical protein